MPIITPDYGTGSSYYTQNFDNIQELLQRIYDNVNNVIVAKDVRDPLWTLWNKISGLSASLGSASISYSLGTPSTISVGGIPEGITFSNATLSELFDQMLLPYVAPVVNNFGPSVLDKQFGDNIGLTLTYSINVGSLPLDSGYAIQFISPNPSSTIPNKVVSGSDPEFGTTNNFSLTYSSSTFSVVSYAVATMSFRTTPDLTVFTATTSIAQKHKRYYGQISIPIGFTPSSPASVATLGAYLTDNIIKGLSYSELSTNVNFSQVVEFDSSGQYFIFASPTVFGFNYPIGFYVDNIFTQNYTKVRSNSNLSNEFGFVAPYDVFIINDKLIDPSLVSTVPLPQGYLGNFNNVIPSVIIGDQGPQGATGFGVTGPSGEIGATGSQGFQGATGPAGEIGATGPAGEIGATGSQGFQGPSGSSGEIGATGPQGFQGATGPSGATTSWSLTGNTGTTPGTNFIGTIDAQDLVFKRNSIPSGKIEASNTSFGVSSLVSNSSGSSNVAFGVESLVDNISGSFNSAFGHFALSNVISSSANTGLGYVAGDTITTGSGNTIIGFSADVTSATANNRIAIGVNSQSDKDFQFALPDNVVTWKVLGSDQSLPFSGTYTPALTNVTNITSSTAYTAQYMRVGSVITVSGKIDIDPTSTGSTELGISLPIASNFANDYECGGSANFIAIAGESAGILADPTNNRASLQYISVDTSNKVLTFIFTYRII